MSQSSIHPYVIVAGVDYSELGDFAVAQAFLLAKGHAHAEVHLLNVVRSAGVGVLGPGGCARGDRSWGRAGGGRSVSAGGDPISR